MRDMDVSSAIEAAMHGASLSLWKQWEYCSEASWAVWQNSLGGVYKLVDTVMPNLAYTARFVHSPSLTMTIP